MTDLKPCPFCGGSRIVVAPCALNHEFHESACIDCGTKGPDATNEPDALKLWDRRVGPGMGRGVDEFSAAWERLPEHMRRQLRDLEEFNHAPRLRRMVQMAVDSGCVQIMCDETAPMLSGNADTLKRVWTDLRSDCLKLIAEDCRPLIKDYETPKAPKPEPPAES